MKKDLQEIELTIKDFEDGIFAVSMVLNPATEDKFVALSEHEIALKVIDQEKRIVVGYALIPDKRIPRRFEDKEFNIFFTADTVKLASEMYMKQLNLNNVTVEHEKKVEDVGIIESWITEDEKHDKINLYGITPKVGGWAIMMKVNNNEEWSKVKAGEYRGFSIEGKFSGFEQLLSEQNKNNNMDLVEEIKAIINAELKSEKVELGVVDEFKKEYNKALDLQAKSETAIVDYNTMASKIVANLNAAGQAFLKANARYQEIEQLSKELGVEPSSVLKNQKETISLAIKEIDSYVKKLTSNKVNI